MRSIRVLLVLSLAAAALAGCGLQNGGTIEGGCADLVYEATGSTGDGVDDVQATIHNSTGAADEHLLGISPIRLETAACGDDVEVSMTVESLSSDGWAGCRITWDGESVSDRAEGDHAVAECSVTLIANR